MIISITYAEGLILAEKFNMVNEYLTLIRVGCTPLQALMEWDLL